MTKNQKKIMVDGLAVSAYGRSFALGQYYKYGSNLENFAQIENRMMYKNRSEKKKVDNYEC
jgi:hypothetical protein